MTQLLLGLHTKKGRNMENELCEYCHKNHEQPHPSKVRVKGVAYRYAMCYDQDYALEALIEGPEIISSRPTTGLHRRRETNES